MMITKRNEHHSDVHSDEDLADLLQMDSSACNKKHRQRVSSSSAAAAVCKQNWFWAIMLVVGMAAALLTTDSSLVRLSPKTTKASTKNLESANNSQTTASGNDNNSNNKTRSLPQPNASVANETAVIVPPSGKSNTPPKTVPSPKPATTSPKQSNKSKTTTWETEGTVVAVSSSTTPATFPFRYRGPKLNDTAKAELAKKWGTWQHIKDDKTRPSLPCHVYDHCDVPRAKFPPNAWQTDEVFLKQYLTQAQALVTRAQEAILAEYGQSKSDAPDKTFAERSINFQLDVLQLETGGTVHPPDAKKDPIDNGGWTTSRSFKGLVRRLLHAIVTQDNFTFALGGHSIAAGHGNHFKQSYSMQFHRVMEPIFGRLGVRLITHNFGHGGLGTAQDSMGMGSLWGKEIDFCMWDSGMTERVSSHSDLFARQALISGNRVPILWNGFVEILETLHNEADVDVGGPGTGMRGIPETESDEHAKTLPYAVQYLKCNHDSKALCDDHKYFGKCWINRADVKPPVKQGSSPGGAAWHHPGVRSNQLTGRVLAFTLLTALQEALKQWKSAPKYALSDSAWHVTAHYQNIRSKLSKLKTTPCFNDTNLPSPRICNTPMKAVSGYSPRANPEQTSIRSIVKDTSYLPEAPETLYHGPDNFDPILEPPKGAVNYLAIVENDDGQPATSSSTSKGRRQLIDSGPSRHESSLAQSINPSETNTSATTNAADARFRRLDGVTQLPTGRGWASHLQYGDMHCNGTYDSDECGRSPTTSCLLTGWNDGRGGLVFDSLSGWLLLQLKAVKEGLIFIKLETWQYPKASAAFYFSETNELTEGWTEENNGTTKRQLRKTSESSQKRTTTNAVGSRKLKTELNVAPDLCPDFRFEYSINGRIESLSKAEFFAKKKFVQRVVETLTLLDDPNFTSGNEMDVELGIRMQGCGRTNVFKLTHLYWA